MSVSPWAKHWEFRNNTIYLNHGSFGPSPRSVREARERWTAQLETQPMQFFLREMEDEFDRVSDCLGDYVGCSGNDLLFVDNATVGMNLIAENLPLSPGDEVLFTDHEYGAVTNIWRRICQRTEARLITQSLPLPVTTAEELIETLFAAVTERTRVLVVSHITSPTGIILPIQNICAEAKRRGLVTCVDGPHAPGMVPIDLNTLDCDFYTASCHKWLSASFGSGFLYVKRKHQARLQPLFKSWARSLSARSHSWKDEFNWIGTRDPAAYLSIPSAIEFLNEVTAETFQQYTHELTSFARQKIAALTGLAALWPDSSEWYGSMIAMPLPATDWKPSHPAEPDPLQKRLWERHRIEVPLSHWKGHRLLRVSCHLYNSKDQIESLLNALQQELKV